MDLFIVAIAVFVVAAIIGYVGCKCCPSCRGAGRGDVKTLAFLLMCVVAASTALAQDVATEGYVPIEKRVRPDRPAKPDRHHKHDTDEPTPAPQPDQQPGEGETVVVDPDFGEPVVEPIEGREEREAKRREREEAIKRHHEEQERHRAEQEKLRQEQEAYDRAHPKPAAPTGLGGFVWSWVIGPSLAMMFGSVAWFFTLSKWTLFFFLLIVLALIGTIVVFFGSAVALACRWCWRKIGSMWSRK